MNYDTQKMLEGVHPDLVKVFGEFARLRMSDSGGFEVRITCGVRTMIEQQKNVARGVSWTLKSRHIPNSNKSGMSEAIDLAPFIRGVPKWDWPYFHIIADQMKRASAVVKIPIVWGGDWKTNKDGPHFELDRKVYK